MGQNNRMQYLAAFAVSLATMTTSTSYFWTAPILPKFHNNETSLNISSSEISWVVAIVSPGIVVGSMVASFVSDKFGRRVTLLASAVPFIVGTVFVLCATKAWVLYIGRFLWGGGCGMITVVGTYILTVGNVRHKGLRNNEPAEALLTFDAELNAANSTTGSMTVMAFISNVSSVYLSEIADKEIRGTLTASTRFMFNFGALLVLAIGSFVTYQVLSSLMIALPICYFLACWRIPETPYYLLKEGKVDAARNVLLSLFGKNNDKMVEEKLSLMRSDVRKEMLRSSSVKELLTGKQYRKAIIITIGLRVTQIFAGSIPTQQYLGRIIQQSNCGLQVSTALIIFGVVRFTVGLVSPLIVDRVGRRPLLIYSYLGACMMLATVGTYFFLQKVIGIDDESSNPFRFVVFIGIVCSIIIASIGFDTLIFIIPSEIFPLNVRSVAMTVLNIFTSFITFIVVKGYQVMEDWTGLYGVFWFYASMAFNGAVFTYFVVPETKGKSLREIQIELQGNIYDDADDNLKEDVTADDIKESTELKELTRE